MWHTPSGDRTLAGAEALLVKAAITGVAEQVIEESSGYFDQWEYGIYRYDELTLSQRLQLLEQVAAHLLTSTNEPLELTAVSEAAVAAIFEHVMVEVDWEIDNDESPTTRWRSLILAAYAESFGDDGGDAEEDFQVPEATSIERGDWELLVESLADNILWDRDFEMEEFLDASPEMSAMLKEHMGIDEDYYSAPAPDTSSDAAIEETYQRLETFLK